MKKQYKIQLPKGKKVTMTNVDFEDGVMTVNVELENKEEPIIEAEKVIKHLRSIDWDKRTKESVDRIRDELYHKKHPETISNYERWKSKFGKINNQWKEVLKANGITREKIEEMAKESIKELEKDCPDIWDKMMQEYGEDMFGKKEQKYEPKDGDFIKLKWETNATFPTDWVRKYYTIEREAIGVFKEIKECDNINYLFCHIVYFLDEGIDNRPVFLYGEKGCTEYAMGKVSTFDEIRPATEEEKKLLIDKLAEVGKRWNPKTKTIEDVRWRAVYETEYFYIDNYFNVIRARELNERVDELRNKLSNYFKTREAAENVAEQIREVFKNSKVE